MYRPVYRPVYRDVYRHAFRHVRIRVETCMYRRIPGTRSFGFDVRWKKFKSYLKSAPYLQACAHAQTYAQSHPIPLELAPSTHVTYVSCTLYCNQPTFRAAVRSVLRNPISAGIATLPCSGELRSRQCAAEPIERRKSPGLNKSADNDAEGADLFSMLIYDDF